jgi:hypothetical protein
MRWFFDQVAIIEGAFHERVNYCAIAPNTPVTRKRLGTDGHELAQVGQIIGGDPYLSVDISYY